MTTDGLLAVAAIIAAVAFMFLVMFAVFAILRWASLAREVRATTQRLGREWDALSPKLNSVLDQTACLLDDVDVTLDDVKTQVGKVDTITDNAKVVTGNLGTLSNIATLSVAVPLVKVASLTHGVKHAIDVRTSRKVSS